VFFSHVTLEEEEEKEKEINVNNINMHTKLFE
jgi:hypothetical protein